MLPPPTFSPKDPYVSSYERLLSGMIAEHWQGLASALGGRLPSPRFSGLLPLGSPGLWPFLERPGVFMVLGPPPSVRCLLIEAAQGPVGTALRTRVHAAPNGGFAWTGEESSDPAPTFLACVDLSGREPYGPPLADRLRLVFTPWGPPSALQRPPASQAALRRVRAR